MFACMMPRENLHVPARACAAFPEALGPLWRAAGAEVGRDVFCKATMRVVG